MENILHKKSLELQEELRAWLPIGSNWENDSSFSYWAAGWCPTDDLSLNLTFECKSHLLVESSDSMPGISATWEVEAGRFWFIGSIDNLCRVSTENGTKAHLLSCPRGHHMAGNHQVHFTKFFMWVWGTSAYRLYTVSTPHGIIPRPSHLG